MTTPITIGSNHHKAVVEKRVKDGLPPLSCSLALGVVKEALKSADEAKLIEYSTHRSRRVRKAAWRGAVHLVKNR